jgi:hypothetical protein
MHDGVELEKQNQTGKTKLVNHPSSTDHNFLIRDQNSAIYPPLERL